MTKNLALYQELKNITPEDATKKMMQTYEISPEEMISVRSGSIQSRVIKAAELLVKKSLDMNLPKNNALAQVVSTNIAVLVTDWKNPDNDTRNVGETLSRMYKDKDNDSLTNMSLLRQDIGRHLFGDDFRINALAPVKNPFDYTLSPSEQRVGLKIPSNIDEKLSFLLGVMRTDALRGEDLKLSGKHGDCDLYCGILENIIYSNFNISPNTSVYRRKYFSKKMGNHELTDVSLSLNWPSIKRYLNDHVNIFSKEGFAPQNFVPKEKIDNMYLAYFMGMIAGGSSIGPYKPILEFHDKENKFLSEVLRVNDERKYRLNFFSNKTKPWFKYLNKETVTKMTERDMPFRISNDQVGMFVNQRHLSRLYDYHVLIADVPKPGTIILH